MSVLVHAEVDGDRLSPDDVLHESLLILVGGDETTRHVISGGMEQLLLHPDQRQLLVDDPAKITVAVEEMLRWVTPDQEHVPHGHARHRVHGPADDRGPEVHAAVRVGQPRRRRVRRPVPLRRRAPAQRARGVRLRRALLPRPGARPARAAGDVRAAAACACPTSSSRPTRRRSPAGRANFISGLESMPVRFTPEPAPADGAPCERRTRTASSSSSSGSISTTATSTRSARPSPTTASTPTCRPRPTTSPAARRRSRRACGSGSSRWPAISHDVRVDRRRGRHRRDRARRALGMADRRTGVAPVRVDARGPRRQARALVGLLGPRAR